MIPLRDQRRAWFGAQEQGKLFVGGQQVWSKPAPPPATIADLYGTTWGKVPMHIAPEAAITNSSSQVTSVPNLGGAGANFNTTKAGAGNVMLANGEFSLAVTGSAYLAVANPADMIGTRLFMVAGIDPASTGNLNIAGHGASTAAGGRTNIQWIPASNLLRLLRWTGSSWQGKDLDLGEIIGPSLRLIEIAPDGMIRVWLDGTLRDTESNTAGWPDFLVSRIFAGYNSPFFAGRATDILSFITDGSAGMDREAEKIRNELSVRNGLPWAT